MVKKATKSMVFKLAVVVGVWLMVSGCSAIKEAWNYDAYNHRTQEDWDNPPAYKTERGPNNYGNIGSAGNFY